MSSDLPSEVRLRDRETGEVVTERVFGGGELRFLYGTRTGRALLWLLAARRPFNVLYGLRQRSRRSRRRIAGFVSGLGIDPAESERPLEDYPSLDAFFTRRLAAGVRPIDPHPDHLVSPADGRALVVPRVAGELVVKRSRVTLPQLLGDPALAGRYAGGAALIVRLAPADYHRFHFPDAGQAGPARRLGGPLHSVHPFALAAGAPSFRNKRCVTLLDTARFGRLALVEVGALAVGTIVQSYRPGPVERGQEKGLFRFGGSTVVVLAEPGRLAFDPDLVQDSAAGLETYVKLGTRVAATPDPAPAA